MAEILIGTSSSNCGACGLGASPSETGHYTIVAYGPSGGTPGCGELWTGVTFTYYYPPDMLQAAVNSIKQWYPAVADLPFTTL